MFGLAMTWIWLIALVFFLIVEAATVGLASIWFALGALCALLVSLISDSLPLQIGVFLVLSLLSLGLIRPIASRWFNPKNLIHTNADRYVGTEAVVTEAIDNLHATGRAQVGGQDWTARAEGQEVIPAGAVVTVLRIEGVKLVVRRQSVGVSAEK